MSIHNHSFFSQHTTKSKITHKKYISLSLSPPNQIPAQIQINHTQFLSNESLQKSSMDKEVIRRSSPMKKRQRSDSEEAYVTAKELEIKNPMPQLNVPPSYTTKGTNGDRIVIVMVGLPARGKTYMVGLKKSLKRRFFNLTNFFSPNTGESYHSISLLLSWCNSQSV